MVAGSHSMKWFVTVGLAAITCFVLGSCRGAGFAAQEAQQAIPDLLAVSPSVTGNGLVADASFTLSATVTNAGDGASPATTLHYYLSTDATIATSDTEVGSDPITRACRFREQQPVAGADRAGEPLEPTTTAHAWTR